jgi:Na+/H+-translocating membrane pyrophosphatase
MESLVYLLPGFGVLALLYMAFLSSWVTKQDAGGEKMQEIASAIADGAMAFLKAEYSRLAIFAVIASALLILQSQMVENSSWLIFVAFIFGASFSALAGFFGGRGHLARRAPRCKRGLAGRRAGRTMIVLNSGPGAAKARPRVRTTRGRASETRV